MTEQAPQPEDKQPSPDSTVLVVDDNVQNRELLAVYLESIPVRVQAVGDGVEALDLIAAEPPDLILLDIMMPKMSGFEVCRKLKTDPATREIPVIMVTALRELGDIERAVESGTDDFLSKPVSRVELVTRVRNLLWVRRLKNELDRTLAYLNELEKRPPSQ